MALLAVIVVLALPWIYCGHSGNDEIELLSNGMRIARGQLIYRDYFYPTPPLTHWISAALALTFGASVVAGRWLMLAMMGVATWQSYQLARWLGARPWSAFLTGSLVLAVFYPYMPGVNHHWMTLPFALQGLLAGLAAMQAGTARPWLLAGVWAGLAMLGLQSDGAVTLIALGGAAVVGGWLAGTPLESLVRRAATLLAGFALPLLVAVVVLWLMGALPAAYAQVWGWPRTHMGLVGGMNDIHYLTDVYHQVPPMDDQRFARVVWYMRMFNFVVIGLLPLLTALAAFAWGLGVLGERLRGLKAGLWEQRYGLLGLAVIGNLLVLLHERSDIEHLILCSVPAFSLGGALADLAMRRSSPRWRLAACLPLLGYGLLVAGGMQHAIQQWAEVPRYMWTLGGLDMRAREDATLAYLHAHARPGDKMVAVPAGGYHYYYGLPAAVSMTTVYDHAAHFTDDAQIDTFWHEVATCGARYLVVDASNEPFLRDAFPGPPPGYKLVYQAPSLRYDGPWVQVYERVSAPVSP